MRGEPWVAEGVRMCVAFKLFLGCGCCCLGCLCGAGRLDGCDDCGLGVEDLEVVVVECADLDDLAEAEGCDVDVEAVGEVGGEALDVELAHLDLEFTAGFYAFAVAGDVEGYADCYWFIVEDLEEVDVEDLLGDGVELDVFEDSLHLCAVDVEVDEVDVGCVDEATEVDLGHGEGYFLLATIDDARYVALTAELLSGLLATALTLSSFDVKSLHYA